LPDELIPRDRRSPLLQPLLILVLFAVVGVAAGWVWFQLWDAPAGVVADHTWYPTPYMPGQRAEFDGVALYVLVGAVAGALAGTVSALLLDRREVATVAAVTVGSALAGWLMALVGTALGPSDPDALARTAADGTKLSGDLVLTGLSPYVAVPAGALLAVLVVFLATVGRADQGPHGWSSQKDAFPAPPRG
jgi:hypothetical protein